MIVVFDVEATDLQRLGKEMPRIIEFAAVKLDHDFNEVGSLNTLINPAIPIPPAVKEITKITDDMVNSAPSFFRFFGELARFFVGVETLVAHNIPYDVPVLAGEIKRVGKENRFPWPPNHLCTLLLAESYFGRLISLGEIYAQVFAPERLEEAHRAMNDVRAVVRLLPWYREEGLIE